MVNTHLHAFHIGGNTRLADGAWVPTFPNATHLMTKTDLEFWDPANNPDIVGSVNENSFEDSLELWLPARSRRTSGCPGSGPSGRRR